MPNPRRRAAWLGATLLTVSGAAIAQTAGLFDPSQLPTIRGKVAQYDLTGRGDVDGLLLDDGTEVHLPPHLGTSLAAIVRPGDAVTIHGLKARALPLVQAMSVTADATGKTVVDDGPPAGTPPGGPGRDHRPPPPFGGSGPMQSAQGSVKMQLHGPRGELDGVLLSDGTLVHLPPPEAERLGAALAPGATLAARGPGSDGPLGHVLEARQIGPTADKLNAVAPPPAPPGAPGGPDGMGDAPPPPPR